MTLKSIAITNATGKFPYFPPRDDMLNWKHLYRLSAGPALSSHLGDPENTLVGNEVPLGPPCEHLGRRSDT